MREFNVYIDNGLESYKEGYKLFHVASCDTYAAAVLYLMTYGYEPSSDESIWWKGRYQAQIVKGVL